MYFDVFLCVFDVFWGTSKLIWCACMYFWGTSTCLHTPQRTLPMLLEGFFVILFIFIYLPKYDSILNNQCTLKCCSCGNNTAFARHGPRQMQVQGVVYTPQTPARTPSSFHRFLKDKSHLFLENSGKKQKKYIPPWRYSSLCIRQDPWSKHVR